MRGSRYRKCQTIYHKQRYRSNASKSDDNGKKLLSIKICMYSTRDAIFQLRLRQFEPGDVQYHHRRHRQTGHFVCIRRYSARTQQVGPGGGPEQLRVP